MLEFIQFSSDIGPLVKIVEKMFGDFLNFVILYFILIFMFGLMGNANFLLALDEYKGVFESMLTVLDSSIGNYDFRLYSHLAGNLTIFADAYVVAIVVCFNILILNLIIAILSNTYNQFDTKATGLYLSKILIARDTMIFDEYYGAFMLSMAPLNIILMPFVPLALMRKPSKQFNTMLVIFQYSAFILIIFTIFMFGSICMLPFAYLQCLQIEFKKFMLQETTKKKVFFVVHLVLYSGLVILMLVMAIFADFYYFCANNFRSNLKKIIIDRKKSTLTIESIKQINNYCARFINLKIKSMYTGDTV